MKITKQGAPSVGNAAHRSSAEEAEPARWGQGLVRLAPNPGWLEHEVVPDDLFGIDPASAQFAGTFSERSHRRRNSLAAAVSAPPRRFTNVGDDSPVDGKDMRNLSVA
jgi:hypothetical protein